MNFVESLVSLTCQLFCAIVEQSHLCAVLVAFLCITQQE